MLDADAVNKLVVQQITTAVNAQVQAVMSSDVWLNSLENKILQYTQDRILAKFNNSSTMPEIIEAVKDSVAPQRLIKQYDLHWEILDKILCGWPESKPQLNKIWCLRPLQELARLISILLYISVLMII